MKGVFDTMLAFVAFAVAVPVSAMDVDYYFYKANGTGDDLTTASLWSDPAGNHPTALFDPTDDYFLMNACYWSTNVFTGRTLNIGCSTNDIAKQIILSAAEASVPDFHIWGTSQLQLRINSSLSGTLTIHNTGGYNFYKNASFYDRTKTICSDTSYINVNNTGKNLDGSQMFLHIAGDYSQMLGHWFVSGGAPTLVLESPTALGAADGGSEYGIRVQYANTVRLAVSNGLELTGIDDKCISLRTYSNKNSPVLELTTLSQFDADDYVVPVNIVTENNYADSIVRKVGSGRVTLTRGCFVDVLEVNDGTLALVESATLDDGMKVTIAAGAMLSLGKGGNFHVASLTVGGETCGNGIYTAAELPDYLSGDGALQVGCSVPAGIAVTYDPATATATPVDLSGETYLTRSGWKAVLGIDEIPVSLSKAVTLPQLATNRMAVAYLPLSGGFTAADFADVSEKSYGLPRTWFETEEQGGRMVLYLVVKPVMVATPYNGTTGGAIYDVANDARFWSDGLVPHPGADYRNSTNAKDDDVHFNLTGEFKGDSYGLAYCNSRLTGNDVTVNLMLANQQGNTKSSLIVYSGGVVALNGTVCVDASCPEAKIKLKDNTSDSRANMLIVNADISGSGVLGFANQYSTASLDVVSLLGDNSGFSGPLHLDGVLTSSQDTLLEVAVTNGLALGGPRPDMDKAGVLFDAFPKLIVNGDADFAAANRCWASLDGLQVSVAEGVTCWVRNPYYSSVDSDTELDAVKPNRCAIEKTGAGTLALAKVVPSDADQNPAAGNGRNDLVRVKEGGLMALAADTFAGCTVAFEDGSAIVVDPTDETFAETGMVLDRAPTIASGAKLKLVPAFTEAPSEKGVAVTFLTVPASTPDLSGVLKPQKVRSASGASLQGMLQKTDKIVDGRACTVYSANYEVRGLILVVQ